MSEPIAAPQSAAPRGDSRAPLPTTSDPTAPSVMQTGSAEVAVPAPAAEEKKLTPKQLKELKKAEKAARRAQSKAAAPAGAPQQGGKPQQQQQQQGKKGQQQQGKGKKGEGIVKTIYVDQKGQGKQGKQEVVEVAKAQVVDDARDRGLVGLLRELELEQTEKKKSKVAFGIETAHPDVHPAILTLGMQINKRVITGSSARCLGFLVAIKRVIEDYKTPEDSSLNRHLPGAYLSHQINFITSARPMATAMGNAIRWLKTQISTLSPDLTEEAAKSTLVEKIDNFIHEKLLAADDVIVNTACSRYIKNGDVILTYSKSSVVEKILLEAKRRGKSFRVIVADNRPLLEGKNLLASLVKAGIECAYIHLYALGYSMREATKVFLGAHAIMANGALFSRSGTAVTATAANDAGVPVLVCCESIKFSDKINIDGIVNNELGDPDGLVNISKNPAFPKPGPLAAWRDDVNTTVVDFMYDVTPAENISMVICEHGVVTPEGVPGVSRANGMER